MIYRVYYVKTRRDLNFYETNAASKTLRYVGKRKCNYQWKDSQYHWRLGRVTSIFTSKAEKHTGAGTAVAYRLIAFCVTSDPRLLDEYRRRKAMQPLSPRFIIVADFSNSSRSNLKKKSSSNDLSFRRFFHLAEYELTCSWRSTDESYSPIF